ncbi:1-acyl-sn-glycerol-3-phosphate acyltransferase [bacterium]|nr:1-acyl-sn-glycerol-3-phosphate acyltransferase [bacterium]
MLTRSEQDHDILRLLYLPYKWFIFMPFLFISTLIIGLMATVLAIIISPRFSSRLCGGIWSRMLCFLTPAKITVTGRQNIDPKQSYIIVSNHQSHYDVLVLYGWLGVDFKWVMKKELRKIPGLGIGCEKIGHIFIDRSNKKAAWASLNAAKDKIVGGTSIIFFPEGTRQEGPKLGPFKKGAFHMALDLRLPILPITIRGTGKILPARSQELFPGKVDLIIHPPIETDSYTEKTMPDLIERVRQVIEAKL